MRILVVGSSSGIGAAICDNFIEKNYHVEGVDINQPQNHRVLYHELDLAQIEKVDDFLGNNVLDFDALIYCAGIRELCNPGELSTEMWTKVFNINITSAFLISKALINSSIKRNKKLNIVNLASISGIQAEPNRAAYVSSKFAMIGLTKQLALQFGAQNIRVNAIAPGIIETPLTKNYFENADMVNLIKKSTPVGYWGQVDNILSLVELCLSNDYLNGSVLVCDGGWTTGKDL